MSATDRQIPTPRTSIPSERVAEKEAQAAVQEQQPSGSEDRTLAAIGELYDRFGASLYRYALVLLANSADAEDVVQNLFVGLVQSGRQISTIRDVKSYLFRAARNEVYSLLRRRRRRRDDVPLEAVEPLLEAPPGEDSALRDQVQQALLKLPAEQREVIVLKVYQSFTLREIANLTGCSLNTAASRYRYASERLAGLLSELQS